MHSEWEDDFSSIVSVNVWYRCLVSIHSMSKGASAAERSKLLS